MNRAKRREMTGKLRKLVPQKIAAFEFPGGESRKSFRIRLEDGRSAIVTRRSKRDRGEREARVMQALREHGGRAPEVIAYDGEILVQEDLGERRLSQSLHEAEDAAERERLLSSALEAMAGLHQAARAARLAAELPLIGAEEDWRRAIVRRPIAIGKAARIPAPDYDVEAVVALLAVREAEFVKWDARPGNALVDPGGAAWWFDWEHAGARNAADDLVWILADEFTPPDPEAEERLMAAHMPALSGALGVEAERYVRVMGVFHSCIRLGLILKNKGRGGWWRMESCLRGDKAGVTRKCCAALLTRAARWAEADPATRPLGPWLREMDGFVGRL